MSPAPSNPSLDRFFDREQKLAAGGPSSWMLKLAWEPSCAAWKTPRGWRRPWSPLPVLNGRKAVALLSDMNQPLGYAVGNALEVREAIDTLHGRGPQDFYHHCLQVAAHMLVLSGISPDVTSAQQLAARILDEGKAWEKFRTLVKAQGGDVLVVDQPDKLPKQTWLRRSPHPQSGYLAGIHAQVVGETAVILGAGRSRKEDLIDHAVGIVVHHKVGDRWNAANRCSRCTPTPRSVWRKPSRRFWLLTPGPPSRLPRCLCSWELSMGSWKNSIREGIYGLGSHTRACRGAGF
jgi:hypothetical protein